jgi:uncharacterized protein (DUF1778 family)
MPRAVVEDNSRLALRVRAADKATLMRAVALSHTDMIDFVLRHALDAARKVIEQAEHLLLTSRPEARRLHPSTPQLQLLQALGFQVNGNNNCFQKPEGT